MDEIKKSIHDVKEEINKDIETLKNNTKWTTQYPNKYHNQKLGE
jgi:gas vesicle protein